MALRAVPNVSGEAFRAHGDHPSQSWDGSESHPYLMTNATDAAESPFNRKSFYLGDTDGPGIAPGPGENRAANV